MNQSSAICRPLDPLGRVVLPMELRKQLNLKPGDMFDIFLEGDTISLRKQGSGCSICGTPENNVTFKGKRFCRYCLNELKKL